MDDTFMITAATTLVAWATTNLADGARSAVDGLAEFLRRRFAGQVSVPKVAQAGIGEPLPDAAHRLAALLEREALRDPAFDAEFRARFARVQVVVANDAGNVTNAVSGDVGGSVVQARDVHGGISFFSDRDRR